MCGICGRYNFGSTEPVTREELKAMNDGLVHRGPDDEGYFSQENVGLAMRRLSIIDLSTGHQPISSEDGSAWIVFNGEIYNFEALRAELTVKGHKFRTRSDTETIIHLYEEKGTDFPKYLRGMFAVAIWDARRRRLVLARDRMGKKPLFYAQGRDFIAFASELAPLAAARGVSREVEPLAVDAFLTLQYVPGPMTVYKGVRKLEPASVMTLQDGKTEISRYWDLPLGREKLDYLSLAELKELVRSELAEATRLRLISEVPLGAFLSGGIDSSIVVALMARASERPVKTFAIGFKEDAFSELTYASQVARMYGTDHTEFVVESDMASVLPKLVRHYGEPYADSSALPSYFVSRETRRAVTVALNGDGGDEAFGGYIRYSAMKAAWPFSRLPAPLKKAGLSLAELLPDRGGGAPYNTIWRARKFLQATLGGTLPSTYLATVSFFKTPEKNALLSAAFRNTCGRGLDYAERYMAGLFEKTEGEDLLNRVIYADYHSYLPECLMTKMDIASMANSLEARSPFLDHKVVELAFRLSGRLKIKGFRGTKWILREAFRDMLPPEIYGRGKMGFGIPLGQWFRGGLKGFWAENCLSEKALGRGYFRPEELRRLWDDHQTGRRDNGYRLWAVMMLELWHREFADDFRLG
ncbi:MAG TPA: asparagine synthase (glutamine-hydrolyzing) [Elusimicrobiales bacterium]|nr:asparagine synthase (glutamine-hydrolyzing) [Elusimicrobiales bacterium]